MRHLPLVVFALCAVSAGCTKSSGVTACIPGEQVECACPGGLKGVQICDATGEALGVCLGCPGGPQLDMANPNAEDMTGSGPDFPPGTDLLGLDLHIPPGSDLSPGPDLANADLSPLPADMTAPADMVGTAGTPCAVVMLVLDQSGSMSTTLPGSAVSRLDAAKNALNKLVANYGGRVPFGLTRFENSGLTCDDGAVIAVEPLHGTASAIKGALAPLQPGGGTNTGNAVAKVALDTQMHDPMRQGSFMILVTDGAPNCDSGDPQFTISKVDSAAKALQPIKTFVIGMDVFFSDDAEMELMAIAGQQSCTSGFCGGKRYYPVKSENELDRALDLIMNKIVASAPGGSCGAFACFPSGGACGGNSACCGTAGCKNLQSGDTENCGECGTSCGSGATCSGGTCLCGGVQCPTNDKCCNGTCCSKTDMSPPADMLKPADMTPVGDLGSLPACMCNKACQFGCVGLNCCYEDTIGAGSPCTATPSLCSCSGGVFPFCF